MSKRLFDIIFSGILLILLAPLLLIIALLIIIESRGNAFFRQVRVGKNGIHFRILKFRTMHTGSENAGQLTIGENDRRITRAGKFLRKYKLDELPQLLNVLIGDMSIVGPRPEVPKYVALYDQQQKRVLDVRPGITDPASIRYAEENKILGKAADPENEYIHVIMPQKIQLNLQYLDKRSFVSDLRIIGETIQKIFK